MMTPNNKTETMKKDSSIMTFKDILWKIHSNLHINLQYNKN